MKSVTALLLGTTALCCSAAFAQTPDTVEGLLKTDGSIEVCGRTFTRGDTAGLVGAVKFCEGKEGKSRMLLGEGEALLEFRRGIVEMPEPGIGSPPPPPPPPMPRPGIGTPSIGLRGLERVLDVNNIDVGVATSPQ